MAQTIFELFGTIAINSNDAKEKIDDVKQSASDLSEELNTAGNSAETASSKFSESSKFGTAAVFMGNVLSKAATAAAGLVKDFAKLSIGFAADMEQNIGGVETLFGEAAQTVFENADKAYKTAGLSANDYMENVIKFAAALNQSVSSEAEAAKLADMAIIDMSDNANKMGTDIAMIQNAYQGFVRNNYTMLDNLALGYAGTKEEMQRLLADAEALTGQKYDISNLSDVFLAIHAIQNEMGITGTTAIEAETTLTGTAASAKAAWENFLTGAFQEAIPKLTELINRIMDWAEANPEKIQEFSDAITDFATASFEGILNFLDWILNNGDTAKGIFEGLAAVLIATAAAMHPYVAAFAALIAYVEELKKLQGDLETNAEKIGVSTKSEDIVPQFQESANSLQQKGITVLDMLKTYNQAKQAVEEEPAEVGVELCSDAAEVLQGAVDAIPLEAVVKMIADTSGLTLGKRSVNNTQFGGTGHSFAKGLDYVPYDGFPAILHKREAVLTASQADAWRSGSMGGADAGSTGRRMRKTSASSDQPINVTLNITGASSNPYEIADEVRNALELLRWQG